MPSVDVAQMKIVFRPAELLLGRLVFVQKFVVLVLVLVVPFGFVVFAYASQQSATISTSEVERSGTRAMEPLLRLGEDMAQARHSAVSSGRPVAVPAADIAAVDRTQRRYRSILRTGAQWAEVRQEIRLAGTTGGHATALAAYDGASIGLLNLLIAVGDGSRLSVDSDLAISDLFSSIDRRIPTLVDTSTRIVDQLNADTHQGMGSNQRVTLLSEVGIAVGVIDSTTSGLDQAFANASQATTDHGMRTVLPVRLHALDDSVSRFDATLRNVTLSHRGTLADSSIALPVLAAAERLNWSAMNAMEGRLGQRIAKYTSRTHRIELLAGFMTLLAIYLFGGFYYLVAGTIGRMVTTLRAFAGGQFTEEIPVTSRDELGYVAAAINDMVSRVRHATARLTHDASHDSLTGLPNRLRVIDHLKRTLPRASSAGGLAVLFVDLDGFKLINDSLGHAAGDAVLRAVSARLIGTTGAGDTVARLSGDEFLVVCQELGDPGAAIETAGRMLEAISAPLTENELGGTGGEQRTVTVGASIGVAYVTDPQTDADALIAEADAAMYRAKQLGRGRIEVFDEGLRAELQNNQRARQELRHALAAGEIEVHYQPIVETQSGCTRGFEALARWSHPERGLLPPGTFMPTAESSGLIVPLGAHVLREACHQLAAWDRDPAMPPGRHMAVNVSTRQLVDREFIKVVNAAVADAGIDPGRVWLEITESALLIDADTAKEVLLMLRQTGVKLVVDDFGTGYSSLQHLKLFPLDGIKIDRGFIAGIGQDPGDEAIIQSLMGLARALGLDVVAEGVETEEQRQWLLESGCGLAQGFLFSKPQPAESFRAAATSASVG